MYTLYFSPGACSMASHILLEECGAEYETKRVALADGEQRGEAYLKINPHGKVPALAVDGKVVTENCSILPYIARKFPDKNLLPSDPDELASAMELASWLSSTVHVTFAHIARPERWTGGPEIGEAAINAIKETARNTFWDCLKEIDARLEGKEWMMGSQFTFLDPYALVFFGWGTRIGLPMAELKNFTAFKDRMMQRPAVRTILEKEQSPLLKAA